MTNYVIYNEKDIVYAVIEKSASFASSPLPPFTFDPDESISIYDDKIRHLISDPEGFSCTDYGEIQRKLMMGDEEITAKMREFATTPVSGIRRISKPLSFPHVFIFSGTFSMICITLTFALHLNI